MSSRARIILDRVRDDAQALTDLLTAPSNIPIEQYIDRETAYGLSQAFGLEPIYWRGEDLERILIIRDGLYALRHKLRDAGDEGEHSIDQLLSVMDRLYADLERALREIDGAELGSAQKQLLDLQRSPNIARSQIHTVANELTQQANEVLTQTYITQRTIEINIIKFGDVNVDLLKNARFSIQRFSASVFAIKLSLEQNVIFEGVFRFFE